VTRSFKSKDLAAFFSGMFPWACGPSNRSYRGDFRSWIRVNMQWRLCFRFEREDAYDVELVDYH